MAKDDAHDLLKLLNMFERPAVIPLPGDPDVGLILDSEARTFKNTVKRPFRQRIYVQLPD